MKMGLQGSRKFRAKDYARLIIRRRGDAILLRFKEVGLLGTGPDNPDWKPKAQHCHANVEMWLHYNPSYRELRGYLLLRPQVRGMPWSVMPHTAVVFPDGLVFDITPRTYSEPQPFVLHIGTSAQWEMMNKAELVEV
jgi:hypothetical protein